jgi:endonuclease/exonuclease/phosphatase family metal-dependent hydrolase
MTLILSYNVKWNSNKNEIHNIFKNINDILNKYDIDFLLFQEAYFYKKIIKLVDKSIYNFYLHKSNKEILLTIYKKKYKIENVYNNEFEKGRPFSIFYLLDTDIQKYLFLINLHAGHHPNIDYHIFNPINKIMKKIENKAKMFIMAGDFNKNITKKYNITTKNKIFKLYNLKSNEKTCCDINNKRLTYITDHVICSKKPIKKITYNKNYPASDHLMILVELKDF